MSTTYRSFAKINLHLAVKGRREDGYHELETVFQTVALADLIELELTEGAVELQVTGGAAPADRSNLAARAAEEYLRRWAPDQGVKIVLRKRLPIGGGVGGGSSNAATVLSGLQDLLGGPAGEDELQTLAAELGADVPFFLCGGTALGCGRGDRIRRLPDLTERPVWLITPPLAISTAEIFGSLRLQERSMAGEDTKLSFEALEWRDIHHARNDLEEPVLSRFPVMQDVYNALVEAGASLVRLSGTGATIFAFFAVEPQEQRLARGLPSQSRVVQTRTLTRSSLDRLRVVR